MLPAGVQKHQPKNYGLRFLGLNDIVLLGTQFILTMTKHLFLVRHAQAVSGTPTERDFERGLSSSGMIEACKMGARLKQLAVNPDLIFTSAATRALDTARYMAEQMDYDTDKLIVEPALYEEFALQSFAEMINAIPEEKASAMVIAHNPKQTYLAEYFSQQEIGAIPTSGVVYIIFENQAWSEVTRGSGKLVWFEYPAKLTYS